LASEGVPGNGSGSADDGGDPPRRPRGIVEIGAGNGQWARAITERYAAAAAAGPAAAAAAPSRKPFEFVLAYDDMSSLPLPPQAYHARTEPARRYFYDRVRPCRGGDSDAAEAPSAAAAAPPPLRSVLGRWECRGRVLLLVYPPHGAAMARDALRAYAEADPLRNDAFAYVGEGRGGANADDSFFDLLESGEWTLASLVPVRPLGSKGHERMHVFVRNRGGRGGGATQT
jgi:hypothetical protein